MFPERRHPTRDLAIVLILAVILLHGQGEAGFRKSTQAWERLAPMRRETERLKLKNDAFERETERLRWENDALERETDAIERSAAALEQRNAELGREIERLKRELERRQR